MARRIVVVGGGFAGLWAAAGAARALDLARPTSTDIEVVLVAPDPRHVIRVRCYEADLAPVALPLDAVLAPIGVRRVEAAVTAIDPAARRLTLGAGTLGYDRLVLAAGSTLRRPPVPGLAEHALDVDSLPGAERLARHLAGLGARPDGAGRWTAVVIGAGLVGIEIACELPGRLAAAMRAAGQPGRPRVVLLERGASVGVGMGAAAPAIREALAALGVEARTGTAPRAVEADAVLLADGERIPAATVLCATGMQASPLAASLGLPCDGLGRLAADPWLAVPGAPGLYAAGDLAAAEAAPGHATVMSCQHARPMGRIAGHNAACDLLGREAERVRFAAPDYVTILDLGPWGAAYTRGWDRDSLVLGGAAAKQVKRRINGERIYPPPGGDRAAILAAAAPVIQAAPTGAAPGAAPGAARPA